MARLSVLLMQRSRAQVALLSVLLGCASPTLASAQDMYPGQDVTVNTGASGSGVLLYPGGKYGRVVGPLLQPGDPYPGMPEKPIHLHMPYRHVAKHVKPKPSVAVAAANPAPAPQQQQATEPAPSEDMPSSDTAANLVMEAAAPPPAPPPKAAPQRSVARPQPAPAHQVSVNKPRPKPPAPFATASAAPPASAAPQSSGSGIPLSLGEEPIQPPSAPPPSHPVKMAKAEPPPAQTAPKPADEGVGPGLTKQSQIIFASGIADPAPSSIDAIKGLSTPLNSALAAGATRVEIVAYGGARGDKSSDARRLSLKRAIIIRQLLIDGGVPTGSIDVRAMGGANDNEPADRVDIFTKA
jgi:outer membrane protein OmpA-like peptidoglycan-associated protein